MHLDVATVLRIEVRISRPLTSPEFPIGRAVSFLAQRRKRE
jgi:hypothetical protein